MWLIISVFLWILNHQTLPVSAQSHECVIETGGANGKEHCVFRNVQFYRNTTQISFSAPLGTVKPTHVTFENSSMIHLPREFLELFGPDLKVLRVESCRLRSVTITSNMVALYARNNLIDKVIVHQSEQTSVLNELDLSMNRLENIQNITRCHKLQVLNLSTNEKIATDSALDLSMFSKFNELRELYLADAGALYLDNTKNTALKSLTLLDLSRNSLLQSDLRFEKLYPYTALQTLKLNNNGMSKLDYVELLEMKSLKTVYLNGNNFMCDYLKRMIDFLTENGISTPSERHGTCQPNQQEIDGMCCTPNTKLVTIKPPPPEGDKDSATETIDEHYTPTKAVDDGAGGFNWGIFGIVVVVLIVVVIAIIGFFVYMKRTSS